MAAPIVRHLLQLPNRGSIERLGLAGAVLPPDAVAPSKRGAPAAAGQRTDGLSQPTEQQQARGSAPDPCEAGR